MWVDIETKIQVHTCIDIITLGTLKKKFFFLKKIYYFLVYTITFSKHVNIYVYQYMYIFWTFLLDAIC